MKKAYTSYVKPDGKKYWRYSYRFNGKQKTLALGVYPEVGLEDARELHQQARKLLKTETDPAQNRKAIKASKISQNANSFEVVAREWYNKNLEGWAPSTSKKIIRRLERDIFPWLGTRPISSITPPELLTAIQRIEDRGAIESGRRTLLNCSHIFRFAISTSRAERNPAPDLQGALKPRRPTHFATIIDPKLIGELLNAIDNYHGSFTTKCALQLAPLVFVRPGELRAAEWSAIDLEKAEWHIKAGRMKVKKKTHETHLVPLSAQAITILREIHAVTGRGKYVFPSEHTNTRPMSENTALFALRRMGYPKETISIHGFRAMARTILDETLGVRPDFIEHQLAHAVRDPNGRAYNRTSHLTERRRMMQMWADYLDKLKNHHNE